MSKTVNHPEQPMDFQDSLLTPVPRRNFLRYAGLGSAMVAIGAAGISSLSGCKKDTASPSSMAVSLGSGDVGILNYAYALEQLEAAFYIQVVATPYTGISDGELMLFTDIRDHEVAHREFFKAALSSSAIAGLKVNFSAINFSSRDSVLATAKAFEDLGVSAYNGAGPLLKTPDYLVLAGKIVSVEARHAAYLRDLVSAGSFAGSDVVNSMGLDTARKPADVLQMASAYITTKIDASQLPTN